MNTAGQRVNTHTAKLCRHGGSINEQRVDSSANQIISHMEKSSNQISQKWKISHPARIRIWVEEQAQAFFQGPGPAQPTQYVQTGANDTNSRSVTTLASAITALRANRPDE